MANNAAALRSAIAEFVETARAHPSDAVGPALERLDQFAKAQRGADSIALSARTANITWMSRTTLSPTSLDSTQEMIEIPYPCTIVGVLPTILLIDSTQGLIEPPPEAIDMFLQVDRKDTFTARTDRNLTQLDDPQVVNLPAIDPRTALRVLELELGELKNYLAVRCRWAVPLATVAAFNWGTVQLSFNWYVDPLRKGRS